MLNIITVPHDTLRQVAPVITAVTPEIIKFTQDLQETLDKKENPKGMGLAAPQVDKLVRAIATKGEMRGQTDGKLRLFINPKITAHSQHKTFGPNPKDPILEGCLSIPKLYGPVPRWEWITVEFEVIKGKTLVTQSETFKDMLARVILHEVDHLDGILFTDYSLELDLPVYQDTEDGLIELKNRTVLETF